MSLTLYTTGIMEEAVVDSATSEATGYPKENLIDGNPDTFWRATTTGDQTIDIDLQEAKNVDALVIFLCNYDTFAATAGTLAVSHSDDDSSYTVAGSTSLNGTAMPIVVVDFTQVSKRYWRISFTTMGAIADVGQIWMTTERVISQSHELPVNDKTIYLNRSLKAGGGRVYRAAVNKGSQSELPRSYRFAVGSDWAALLAAFNDCRGSLFPVILYDGTNYTLVNFDSDELDQNKTAYAYYQPAVTFIQVPYIRDGDSY